MSDPLTPLLDHYAACLDEHGATIAGVDYGDRSGAEAHYRAALGLMDLGPLPRERPVRLLDFGCGWGPLYEYLLRHPQFFDISYTGLDISEAAIKLARERFGGARFICRDIRREPLREQFDYCLACGVFPRTSGLHSAVMWSFLRVTVKALWDASTIGVAFNVLSSHVDYQTDDWLHVPYDQMANLLDRLGCRTYLFRADYAWPGYMVYAYH